MSLKESKAIKAASHREAIQKAAVINNPATAGGKSSTKLPAPASRASGGATGRSGPPTAGTDEHVSSIHFTVGPVGDPINDDYEGNKVTRAKKSQQDADVRMVADLDRWG